MTAKKTRKERTKSTAEKWAELAKQTAEEVLPKFLATGKASNFIMLLIDNKVVTMSDISIFEIPPVFTTHDSPVPDTLFKFALSMGAKGFILTEVRNFVAESPSVMRLASPDTDPGRKRALVIVESFYTGDMNLWHYAVDKQPDGAYTLSPTVLGDYLKEGKEVRYGGGVVLKFEGLYQGEKTTRTQ